MNKTALFLSAALTVLVIFAVGGIALGMNRAQAAADAAPAPAATGEPAAAPAADPAGATLDPQLEKIWMEREAAYQQRIAEANARLAELQTQLAGQAAALAAEAQAGQITPEQAAAIAADYLGQTSVYSVTLVSLGGGSVYEVVFPTGDIVYVGLDGQIVGSVPAQTISSGGGGGGGHGLQVGSDDGAGHTGDHDDDHDGEDHDD